MLGRNCGLPKAPAQLPYHPPARHAEVGHLEQGNEFAGKKLAPAPFVGQRGERPGEIEIAGVAAVVGFVAPYREQDLGRHAIALLDGIDLAGDLAVLRAARADPGGVDMAGGIGRERWRDGRYARLVAVEPDDPGVEAQALGHPGDRRLADAFAAGARGEQLDIALEAHFLRRLRAERERNGQGGEDGGGEPEGSAERNHRAACRMVRARL